MACVGRPLRWAVASCAPVLLVVGCNVGSITMETGDLAAGDAGPSLGDAELAAAPTGKELFDRTVMPLLETHCVACHAPGRTGPAFIAADPDVYTVVMSWPALVSVRDPGSSRLLTKGEHTGPAWTGDQASVIRDWLSAEATARAGEADEEEVEYRTSALAPDPGFNAIPLEELGLDGASLTFTAERVGGGLYLSNLQVSAGPGGAHLVHPVVITWVGGAPLPDVVDRMAGVEVMAPPYETRELGGGTFVVVDFPEGALLSFLFDAAGPLVATGADGGVGGDGGVPSSGCSNVAGFTTNAQPQFATYCVRCHAGGDPMAASAVDMTAMADLSAEAQQRSCNEILTRINRADPRSSPLFLQPDPASGSTHPFKFDSTGDVDAFFSSVLFWLSTEAR